MKLNKIKIFGLLFFLFMPAYTALAGAIDHSSLDKLLSSAEEAFFNGEYDLYEQAFYYSPEFKEELKKEILHGKNMKNVYQG